MKLLSYNIAIRMDNSKQVAGFIKAQKLDFIAFQEVIRHLDESVFPLYQSKYQIEKIIGKDFPHKFFGPLWITDVTMRNGEVYKEFGGDIEQGNEILSKFPITYASNEFFHRHYEYSADRTDFYTEDHSRAVEVVEINVNGEKIQILNVHGLYSKDKKDTDRTIKQCKYILKAAKRKDLPTIIVGDFNLLPDTKSIGVLDKEFRNLIKEFKIKFTRPVVDHLKDTGKNVVDYIFVNDKIKVNDFKVIETEISDHYPLILDFEIK